MPAKPTTRQSDPTHVGQGQPTRAQHARDYAFWVERFSPCACPTPSAPPPCRTWPALWSR